MHARSDGARPGHGALTRGERPIRQRRSPRVGRATPRRAGILARVRHQQGFGACESPCSRPSPSPKGTPTSWPTRSPTPSSTPSSRRTPRRAWRASRSPRPGMVVVAGEITTTARVDIPEVVRATVRDIGYTDSRDGLRRRHLRRPHRPREAEPGHRAGRDTRRAGLAQGAGGRRPGAHVRLRDRRDAATSCRRPSTTPTGLASAWRAVRKREGRPPPPRRQDPGDARVRGRRARCASTPSWCRPSTTEID